MKEAESFDSQFFGSLRKISGELFCCGMWEIEDVGDDFEADERDIMLPTDPSESGAFHVFELSPVLEKDFEISLSVIERIPGREDGGGEVELFC